MRTYASSTASSQGPSTGAGALGASLLTRRGLMVLWLGIALAIVAFVVVGAQIAGEAGQRVDLGSKFLPPSASHWFGTDWMGRDMLARTLQGLRLSLGVGLLTAFVSSIIGTALGLTAGTFRGAVDAVVSWLIDTVMSVPHLVLIILVAFVLGGGVPGVIGGVVLTHWVTVARVVRIETLTIWNAEFVQASLALGKSRLWIASRHVWPHVAGQMMIAVVLLFPHAILHEASITFLGLGLGRDTPAVGVILSESMRYLSAGYWWLGLLPGMALLVLVKLADSVGETLRDLSDPRKSHL